MPHPPNRLNAIRLVQGQTKSLSVTVKTSEGRPATLVGAKLYMSVRKTAGSQVLIEKTSDTGGGIEVTDAVRGVAVVTLNVNDTGQLEAGTYRYDIWCEFPGDPPVRQPVVQYAEIHVEDSVTSFGA